MRFFNSCTSWKMTDENVQAEGQAWEYAFGFMKRSALACAIELGIPDLLEEHGDPVSLYSLSSAVNCPPNSLHRLMRFLSFNGVFKVVVDAPHQNCPSHDSSPTCVHYVHTPVSRNFTRDKIAPFLLLNSAPAPEDLTVELLRKGKHSNKFKSADDEGAIWHDEDILYNTESFNKAMSNHSSMTTKALVDNYREGFQGINTLVDVGGRHGMALHTVVKAFPWIRGICLDLPQVVATAPVLDGIEFVGGSMFERVPKADAVMLMWILHDWSDELCVNILKKCKDAIPVDTGKVIIIDAVVDESTKGDEFTAAHLAMDLIMMTAVGKGKERTYSEWSQLINAAGFTRHRVKNIKAFESVIEAYP